eukprot:COSAG01_NODE_738_length_13926_cov_119.208939_6_plen_171_part_00
MRPRKYLPGSHHAIGPRHAHPACPSLTGLCAPCRGQGFILDSKSGLESQTTGPIPVTEEQAQQIVIVWGASTCPANVARHEELFGAAAKSLREAEKLLFTKLPPDQKTVTNWLDGAKEQVAQVAVNDALVSELGEAEAQRVVAEFNQFLSELQDVANAWEGPNPTHPVDS